MERFLWVGPVGHPGGYGAVARNYVRGLAELGTPPVVTSVGGRSDGLGARDRELLDTLPTRTRGDETAVIHVDPSSIPGLVAAARKATTGPVVGCTLAETDRIPASWVAACNLLDEVWVPTEFNMLTFARSGVEQERLRLVPYGLDVASWTAEGPASQAVAEDAFCFLYSFAFDWRKGFDVLLAAYLEEFSASEPVELVLKAFDPPGVRYAEPMVTRLGASAAQLMGALRHEPAPVRVLDRHISQSELVALYRRADLYVSTERASGWGMPCMEVMAMGGVAAALDWGGATEFMTPENSLLIEPGPLVAVDERLASQRADYAGQRWPELSVPAVRRVLREAFEARASLPGLGARAREEIHADWSAERAAGALLRRNAPDAYRSRAGLRERLRPQVGLSAESPFAGAQERILVAAYEPGAAAWRAALDAHLEAFGEADPVTLCLLAAPGTDPETTTAAVVAHLTASGADLERIPDTLVLTTDPEEALVEPRVAGLVEPGTLWPYATRRIAPTAAALRAAVGALTARA